ncbi:MAG: prepilin-type N-terminal cleavage/methylation domain-containing protein [Patescibacteria group bacterium]|nr:prepilin-type N-terminal cleavage/methylation domain-containing protein [Patescibacteria group bacterium]
MNKQKQKGQAMVEAMVALSIIVVGILGVFNLTSQSLSLNRVDADRYVAVNLANEGIELVKNLLDDNIMNDAQPWNYLPGFVSDGNYEMDYSSTSLTAISGVGSARYFYFSKSGSGYYRYPQAGEQANTTFQRVINITTDGTEHIKVISTVYWTSRGSLYSFSVEDHFYDLKNFKFNLNNQL